MSLEFTKLAEVGEATELADGDYILAVKNNTVQKIQKSLASSDGVFIIDLDELGSEYGTYDASKLTAWGEFYEKVKATLVSGGKMLVMDAETGDAATQHDYYYVIVGGAVERDNSSGRDTCMALRYNDTTTLTLNSESGALNKSAFYATA